MGKIASLFGTRRRRLSAVAAVVLIAAVTWYVGRSDADGAMSTTTTAEASTSTVQDTVSGSGTLAAARSVTLAFSSSGRVTGVRVAAGDTVRQGEELASIDTTALQAALASAQAQLDAAETTAAGDGAESSAQQAANTAKVASAQADVVEAQQALDDATLTAPFAGMVASVGYEEGDQAGTSGGSGGSAGAGAGTTATSTDAGITVITPSRFVLTASISAADVQRITTGMQAQVTPTGATEAVFGTVGEVGRVAETGTDGTATFPVTIALTGEQKELYAGTSATVSIIVESRDDVLTVPTAAITTEDDTAFVTKVTDGKTEKTEVEIGETFGMTTEIVKGLSEGDTVQYEQAMRTGGRSSGGSGEQSGFPGGGSPDGGMPGGEFPGGAMPGGRS